jgi:hypothetical protein
MALSASVGRGCAARSVGTEESERSRHFAASLVVRSGRFGEGWARWRPAYVVKQAHLPREARRMLDGI